MSSFYEQYWQERGKSGFRPRYKIFYDWIESNASVLDIGCGDGYFGQVLVNKKNISYRGLDISETAVAMARERGLVAEVCDASQDLNKFADKSVDYVLMSEFIEHISNSEEVLKEARRIARKAVLVSVPNIAYWKHRLELLSGTFPRQWAFAPNEHLRFWSITDFIKTADSLGFSSVNYKASNGKKILREWWPNLFGFQVCFLLKV